MRAVVFAVVMALGATTALAQDRSATKKEAERFFRAGERSFNKGEYLLAAQAFEEAYKRFASPAIGFSAAQAYRLQYFDKKEPMHLKRAVELYRLYLDAVKSGGRRADAVASLAELEPILQRLEESTTIDMGAAQARVTKLLISSQIEAARVRVNGGEAKAMPLAMEVVPGKYRIQVEVPGYFAFDETREVFEGQFRVVEVMLRPKPGLVRVSGPRGATVSVDGRRAGQVPLARAIEVAAGKHVVAVQQRGHRVFVRELSLERGEAVDVEATLRWTMQRKIAVGVLGTSGASLLLSGVYLAGARSADKKASDLLDLREREGLSLEQAARYQSLREQKNDRLRNAYIAAGVGAAIGAAGALLFYLDSPDASEARGRGGSVAPVAGAEQVGVSYSSSF